MLRVEQQPHAPLPPSLDTAASLHHHLNCQAEAYQVYYRRNQIARIRAQDMPAEYFAICTRQEFCATAGLIGGDGATELFEIHAPHAVLDL
jgi:hypothetical protein